MKTIVILLIACFIQKDLFAAGYTLVEISKVKAIEVFEDKIVIQGDAKYQSRIVSDEEHGNTTVGSLPAQWVHAMIYDGSFVILPYELNYHDPRDEHLAERARIAKEYLEVWEKNKKDARLIKVGDAMTITFQGEETLSTDFRIVRVEGSGRIQPKEVQANAEKRSANSASKPEGSDKPQAGAK